MKDSSISPQLVDARNRTVPQLDPYELWLTRRTDVIPADVLTVLAREIGLGLARGQRVLFYISLLCVVIVLVGLIERCVSMLLGGGLTLSGLARAAQGLLPVCPGPIIFWVLARRTRFRRTTRAMLRHRRCPHCGYDLRGLPTLLEDGATICPECGCAWKLSETPAALNARSVGCADSVRPDDDRPEGRPSV